MKTRIYKSYSNGWQAESMSEADDNGQAWQISTHKAGKGVKCYAIQGKLDGEMFSYEMFGAKRLELYSEVGQCTEKKVKEVHEKGLLEFMSKIEELTPKNAYKIEVGQIIFTDWVQSGEGDRRVIYEIESAGNYKTVQLDGKGFHRDDRIRPYSERFGIGVYYNEGEKLPLEEVAILVEAAKDWQEITEYKQNQAAQQAKEYKEKAILEGSKIVSGIPEWATAVIVAELKEDESDHQTDYFASSTAKTIYLAFSKSKRENFEEMRKAAAKFEETAKYSVKPQTEEGQEADDEHRENYSGGSGYYLGESKYYGWIVRKFEVHESNKIGLLQNLQIAASEQRFFCDMDQTEDAINIAPVEVTEGEIKVIEYGKGIAVIGNTRPIKDNLKALGGRFNFRLTCGAGWVFPMNQLENVKQILTA